MFSTIFYLKLSTSLFIGHGFCDIVPLVQTMGVLDVALYILIVAINIYLHLINIGISTLFFLILSGIHFSGDFVPRNKLKLPGLGFFIIGFPIFLYFDRYLAFMQFLEVPYPECVCYILMLSYVVSLIDPVVNIKPEEWVFDILIYSFSVIYLGPIAPYLYIVSNHMLISIYELCRVYSNSKIYITWGLGSIIIWVGLVYIENVKIHYNNYSIGYVTPKRVILGGVYGLLNAHTLTTLYWRYKEI